MNRRRKERVLSAVPKKVNIVLQIVLVIFFIIFCKVSHLTIMQHDAKVEEAYLPRKKIVTIPALRGTIRDRFNNILAANEISYRLTIVYSRFQEIPRVVTRKDSMGNKEKRFLRREYIHALSKKLSKYIAASPERIADVIHAHASLNNTIPFVLKDGLTEKEYYTLKMLEKDWVGLSVEKYPKRVYPHGKVGADVIGYIAPIQKAQYNAFIDEIRVLKEYIQKKEQGEELPLPLGFSSYIAAKRRLLELREKAYSINDCIGRAGIELQYEEELRGAVGQESYFVDARGNSLRKMPGCKSMVPGSRVLSSVSIELQKYAEELLLKSELDREELTSRIRPKNALDKVPWVRGGAVVAIEPNTGKVVALATTPRFDPNDFVSSDRALFSPKKVNKVSEWLRTDRYIQEVWELKRPLEREVFLKHIEKQSMVFDWDMFLSFLLPRESIVSKALFGSLPIREVIRLQNAYYAIQTVYPEYSFQDIISNLSQIKTTSRSTDVLILSSWVDRCHLEKEPYLLLDLSRLILDARDFSSELIDAIGDLSIATYRKYVFSTLEALDLLKEEVYALWYKQNFSQWRKEHERAFIKEKRREEIAGKTFVKPYLDYLDREAKRQFQLFWNENRIDIYTDLFFRDKINGTSPFKRLLEKTNNLKENIKENLIGLSQFLEALPKEQGVAFIETCRGFSSLDWPLFYTYRSFGSSKKLETAQDLIRAAFQVIAPGNCLSFSYRQPALQGSIFKLVVAYTALKEAFEKKEGHLSIKESKLFTMVDNPFYDNGNFYLGYLPNGSPLPQIYKGGRIPKSLAKRIGSIDLYGAIESSSNPYFALLAGEYIEDTNNIIDAAKFFGYGEISGVDLKGEFQGKIPDDIEEDKNALYSFAIGQHTLLATPLQTAVMISGMANGGTVLQPRVVDLVVGIKTPLESISDGWTDKNTWLKKSLSSIGVNFPVFSEELSKEYLHSVTEHTSTVRRKEQVPSVIQGALFKGMQRVVHKASKERYGLIDMLYARHPELKNHLNAVQQRFIGKTSSSESEERLGIDLGQPKTMYTHTWFGGISFSEDLDEHFVAYSDEGVPELVIVVYLRYGLRGKEALPFAAAIAEKWREIKEKQKTL